MNYCSHCGSSALNFRIPEGDNLPRYVCDDCQTIHYENPRIIVGCLPVWEGDVLLCKRAIEPRIGLWTLPCGFMENGERVEEGAIRETEEEANAAVSDLRLHTVYSIPHINQVYMVFYARLLNLNFFSGPESLDVRLFSAKEIPWDEIAFSSVQFVLEKYTENPDSESLHIGAFSTAKTG